MWLGPGASACSTPASRAGAPPLLCVVSSACSAFPASVKPQMTVPVRCCYESQALHRSSRCCCPHSSPSWEGTSISPSRWVTIAEGKGAVPSSRTGRWSVGEQLWGTTGLWALPEQLPANTWPSEHARLWFICLSCPLMPALEPLEGMGEQKSHLFPLGASICLGSFPKVPRHRP